MTRIIAIVWNHRASHSIPDVEALRAGVMEAGASWAPCWEEPGLEVFARTDAPAPSHFPFEGTCGVLYGRAFRCGSAAPIGANDIAIDALVGSSGGSLFQSIWGSYLAFVRDHDGAATFVVRDPSGAMPCFMAKRGWAFVFFTDRRDVTALALSKWTIDWDYLLRRAKNNRTAGEGTGFAEVEELPPGAIARVGQGRRSVKRVWNPESFAATNLSDANEAAQRLRTAVISSCAGFASSYDRIGVKLSGGLDSTIVLSALAMTGTKIAALNLVTPTSEGDERVFARRSAARAGAFLTESIRHPENVDLRAAVVHPPCVRPHLWLLNSEAAALEAAHARAQGIDIYFTGRGGDNVFGRSVSPHALADCLIARGDVAAFLQRAWAYAEAQGETYGAVLREVAGLIWRHAVKRRPLPQDDGDDVRFLSEKARELVGETGAFKPHARLLPGKQVHLAAIADRLNYFESDAEPPHVHPLVAQPVLEASLSIAAEVLSPFCADRGLARQAFAADIPPEILARRSKGRTNSYATRVLINNLGLLRSFLLHGALEGAGMLERAALNAALSEGALLREGALVTPIVSLLNVEAWLRCCAVGARNAAG